MLFFRQYAASFLLVSRTVEMAPDDFDDLLDDRKAELEQRFRDLERDEELARMRGGGAQRPPSSKKNLDDDLSDLKSALGKDDADADPKPDQPADQAAPNEAPASDRRYVLLLCPHCDAKNRTDLVRVRTNLPRCGACKKPLSFTTL